MKLSNLPWDSKYQGRTWKLIQGPYLGPYPEAYVRDSFRSVVRSMQEVVDANWEEALSRAQKVLRQYENLERPKE